MTTSRELGRKLGWTTVERPDLRETFDYCPLHPRGFERHPAVAELEDLLAEVSRPSLGMNDSIIEEVGRAAAKRIVEIALARVRNTVRKPESGS